MQNNTRFELADLSPIKATLSVTATIDEWRKFIEQCDAYGNKTYKNDDGEFVGNCYVLEFGWAIKRMLEEAERKYTDSVEEEKAKNRKNYIVLDRNAERTGTR